MILPIFAYGHPVLKEAGIPIDIPTYPALTELIQNMWDTMYAAKGVGLAAPQIGLAIQLFIVDTTPYQKEEEAGFVGIKKVFINAVISQEEGTPWAFEEGCLSIPDIRADIDRKPTVTIQYQDITGADITETYDGLNARVIQHEYDHTQGVLFIDHLKPLKKRMLQRRLEYIRKGQIESEYRIKFYRPK
jgi:peptide deformylase